jgi:hypothetical protein
MPEGATGPRLRTPAAADHLGIAESTLEKMRCFGTGPEFERVGTRIVVYSIAALDAYLAARRATSTSEPPPGGANGTSVIAGRWPRGRRPRRRQK